MLKTNVFLLIKKTRLLLTIFVFISLQNVFSQIGISKPVLGFSQACPSPGFNTFNLSFTFSPVSGLASNNIFSVELSDGNGSFASPVVLATSSLVTSPVSVAFSMPLTVNGNAYKIRIKSSSPQAISPSSDAFNANFASFTNPFTINNGISAQTYCLNGTYLLKVDQGGNSPTQFPQLVYKWFKNGSVILGQTGSTLSVNSDGTYFVQIDYGLCVFSNANSNAVTMTGVAAPTLVISSQNNETEFCDTEWIEVTSLDTNPGNVYTWYFNQNPIAGATSFSYTATQSGSYYLKIVNGVCEFTSNTIVLSTIDTSAFITNSDSEIEITPGESVTIQAQGASSYEWSVNNVVVSQTSSYTSDKEETIQLIGIVNGCTVTKTFTIRNKQNVLTNLVPNLISPNNDGKNDTWVLPDEYYDKNDVEIIIFTNSNQIVYKAKNYQNDWPKSEIKKNMVYYYKIVKNNAIVNKGTLSVIEK